MILPLTINSVWVAAVEHLFVASILYLPASAAWTLTIKALKLTVVSLIFSLSILKWSDALISRLSFRTFILAIGLAHTCAENSHVFVKLAKVFSSSDLMNLGGTISIQN